MQTIHKLYKVLNPRGLKVLEKELVFLIKSKPKNKPLYEDLLLSVQEVLALTKTKEIR